MSDELDLELDDSNLESDEDKQRKDSERALKRNKDLSDKLKMEAEARAKAEEEANLSKKEAEFYKNFNLLVSKYQGAAEYQEQIMDRAMKGYDTEEATLAVLAKEGKYTPPAPEPQPEPIPESPAGGSAVNAIPAGGEKPLSELTSEEKQAQLEEALNRGDISFRNL